MKKIDIKSGFRRAHDVWGNSSFITKAFLSAGAVSGALNLAHALHIRGVDGGGALATVMCFVAAGVSYYADKAAAEDRDDFARKFPSPEEARMRDQKISEIIGALKHNAEAVNDDAPAPHNS